MSDSQDLTARRANLTAEQRAKLKERLRGGAAAGTAGAAEPAIPRRTPAPGDALSFAQQRQWFLWKLDPASTAYHLSGGLRLTGALDVQALHASLQALVERHASLRTLFCEAEAGDVVQVVAPTGGIALPLVDLGGLDAQARDAEVALQVRRIRTEPFDLTRGPLVRAVLLKTAPQAHQLLVVMHHIVSDGWSVQLILDELAVQYAARVGATVPVLPELPIDYADYAAWQNRWLEGGEGARQLAWWREHLGSEQPVISLHTDRPRAADGRYRSARHAFALPADTVARLRRQAQAQGATLFMALLAGFNALLFRLTAQADLRVGVPIASRNRAETAGVVGFFVNTQVLRTRIGARTTLAELLAQTRDTAIGAQTHQDLPFEQLVAALRPERSMSANPLFQVMFNHLRRDHRSLAEWPGVAVERLDFEEEDAQFELTLQTLEHEDGRVEATLLYAAELFDASSVERMASHYLAVLQALADAPQQAVADVALIGEAERRLLDQWAVNARVHEGAEPVHRLIERHAAQTPDATALLFGDEALGYGELNARANRLAHRLAALGVGVESRVGLAVERSVEMMVGILAVLKAGGAYVPLDPEQPADRLAYMAQDSGIGLLLTQSHLQGLAPWDPALRILALDSLDLAGESAADPQVPLHGANLAYVIYTSGSTGRPKGAAIRHDALFSCMAWMQQTYVLGAADTVLHKAPFGFDVSVWEMFWPLTTGARLLIARPGDHRDPERLVELIRRHQVTTLNFVPSMLQAFLAYEGIEATTRLRYIICGGEAMPAATQREALERLQGASLQNLYGPTEATIHVTQWTCRDDGRSQVPIGRPISDTQALVLDASLNPVPVGVAGELYLGGVNLARGYLNRAGLTAERFVATHDGRRLYRTGDLVRWNNEGQLEYLGRIDHQVKVRGFRIELGEIEAQLLAQPEVREAVVVADEGPAGARLVGYVSAHEGREVDAGVLRERLGRALPDYMVPGAIVVLPTLPLNANGKVDRKALPAAAFERERAYEAPVGEAEELLARIWAEVLGVERVGRDDSFFELGGDSILSLKVVARAHREGLRLSPRQMFEHQRLAGIAKAAGEAAAPETRALPVLAAARRAGPLALSHAQLRQWFLWQLDPQSTAYHISGALKLDGALDADAVRASFAALVRRHESLRTVFAAGADGVPEQVVREGDAFDFARIDLAAVADAAEREARAAEEARRLSATPFDLTRGPLLRVGLIRLAVDAHLMVVTMHHIVSDGWSMQVLVDEFVALYGALSAGTQPALAALPLQYADYAAWQREWLEAGETERQLAYWKAQLGGAQPVLQLPTDHARRVDGRYRAARFDVDLPAALVAGLQRRAHAQGATLFVALLAGFQVLLHRYTGEEDIRVGVPIANRERAETAGVIGFFVNTQVLRGTLDGRARLAQVLARAHEAARGAQAHQDLPFEQLVEALQPERQWGTNPLFQVVFNHQRGDLQALERLPGLALSTWPLDEQAAQFELTLDTSEHPDGRVRASFAYAAELFDATTIARMGRHYLAVLEALAVSPDQAVGDVRLQDAAEAARLAHWGAKSRDFHDAMPLHHRIERHAAQQPDAIALVFGDETLCYGELNARANRLAHRLIALGVAPEARVGIAVERSLDMVVGILAILKAGGAYVPLDPEYPADRLAYMVQDSGIGLLLTQAAVRARIPAGEGVRVLELDAPQPAGAADAPADNPQVALHADHLAYVIYTSGSTGRPKGAQLCHRHVTRLLDATAHWFGFGPQDVWTLFHSYAFDFSVWEIFGALCTGGRLVVVPFWVSRSPEDFLRLLRAQQVTVLNQTPSAFGQLTALAQAYEEGPDAGPALALRTVIFGGEALEPQRLRRWIAHHGDQRPALVNMYGITETTVHVTHRRITADDIGQPRSPVGIAIPDLGLQVLDARMNPVPVGIAGELHVSGAGLARGYLNRAGLTAERFVATHDGRRLYRTGDLVRWNNEGQLEYLGRIDHQVKVRGFRIELGEIEAQLLAQPEVREAVVLPVEAPGGTRLVAYASLAGTGAGAIDAAALRERLGQVLPDYMVPGAIVLLEALPLNNNGKIDRKALPDPDFASDAPYVPPEGPAEEALARIWAEVLGVARVGRNDNFFELGGHSLLALRLQERLREAGFAAQVRTLFEHPRLGAFAQATAQAPQAREVVVPPNGIPAGCEAITPEMVTLIALDAAQIARIEAAVPGGARNVQDIYPATPLQEGILFHHLLEPEQDAYVTAFTLAFDGRGRLEGFIESFNTVIARHDILRTAMLHEGLPEPVQVVLREARLALEWLADVDPRADAVAQLEAQVSPARHRVDVRRAPMIRAVALHDAAQGRWLLRLLTHHLVDDNTTLKLVVEEIALLQQGREAELPRPVPFRRYVAQSRLGVSRAEHEAFFTQMLGDVAEPTAPFDLLDVRGDGSGVEEAREALDAQLARQVRQQAQRHGVSAATLFHLAWAMVVGRATGRDDVVFGTVLFGRMQGGEGAERALGMFINTLPLRVKLGTAGVEDCLRQTHAALTGLLHHEHASLSLAQRCSALTGGTPLFSSLLNYRYSPADAPQASPGWDGMTVLGGQERTNYPVAMSIDDGGEGFELTAQVMASVGARRVAGMMLRAVEAVVRALAARARRPAADIELLAEAERAQLTAWSANPQVHPGALPVHRLFEQQAALRPDAPALVFGERTLSYRELNARANRLAHRLIAMGVGPETPVGIALERSFDMVAGILAIVKAGGAYVPMDPELPSERIAYMLGDSAVGLLLTQRHLAARMPAPAGVRVLAIDTLDTAAEPDGNPAPALHGENLAYVIYTSGSTGKPKGAGNRHRSLYNRLAWMQEAYGLGAGDTVLQKTPFSFDVSVWEFFWPLMAGARLVVANPGDHREPERLVQLIRRHGVDTLHFVPSMLQAFLAHEGIEACTSLRRIVCSGEALPAQVQAEVFARLPGASLYNLYGPTEAAIDVTHWTCRPESEGSGRSQPPIGRPISDTQALVLDASLNPVPVGVAGELYLGGVNLARGYLNRAGLTAERFVATHDGRRLYRTGDLVRWNNEGQLEYLGRIDHQVKVRGFRIELGEIEAQLLAQPGVREAVVVADEGPAGARLVGYVSAHEGREVDAGVLRERLGRALPDYMVPGAIVVLPTLPLNANGKVDRKALPAAAFERERAYEAPVGEAEELLARIWAEVLGVERVGRDDSFFELGGHSLLALRLLERMREAGFAAQVRTLFAHPRLAAFAQATAQAPQAREVVVPPNGIPADCEAITPAMLPLVALDAAQIARIEAAVPGGARNIQDIYPLAPLQEGMLFHHLLQAEGDAYVTPHALAFDSRARLERFIESFNAVIARHDILRTAVLHEGLPEPVQVVLREARIALEWLQADAAAPDAAARLAAHVDPSRHRIDVRRAPMIRAVALHDAARGRWLLQLLTHHLVLDHTTLDLLVEEIALLQQGREAELPQPVPFRRYVAQSRLGLSRAEHEAFFTQMLGDVAEPTAPFDLLDVRGDGSGVEEAREALDDRLARQVRQQAQRHGVSAATLFHLAWAMVVGRATGRDDVVFGTVLFGRMQGGEGAERALGMFINTLPLRVKLGTAGVEDCLRQTHAALTGLLHHEHASLSLAQRCSALAGGTPLFSSLLNYRYTQAAERAASVAWEGMEVLGSTEHTNYPLAVSVDDMGEGFELGVQVTATVGAQRVCTLMRLAVEAVAQALAEQPQRAASGIELLSPSEQEELQRWGVNMRDGEAPPPVHRLVAQQARLRPDATALILGDARLSYGELDRRANRLAHRLIALGVGPEVRVGIALERSLEMVVGLLAILKAGGAYVPMDPEYPAERLAHMVRDSGIGLLLTHGALRARVPLDANRTVQVLEVDAPATSGAGDDTDPAVAVHPGHLTYVIYTSGSTGLPKGVMVAHGPFAAHCVDTAVLYEMGPASCELHFLSFSFDGAHERLFTALCCGASLLLRDASLWSAEQTLQAMRSHGVTNAGFPPVYLRQLAEWARETGECPPVDLYSFGGEAMSREGFEAVRDHLQPRLLINGYGPTEAVVTPMLWKVDAQAGFSEGYAPIGQPVAGRKAYVLDADMNRVPRHVAGELYLGGTGLARGYLARAGLSAERFVADPFDARGGRLYRTGDWVRWRDDGQLEYLGRIDHQVKVRGFRIELGEIEAQLLAQPEVRQAVVVAAAGPHGTRLVAYVAPEHGRQAEAVLLRERLGRALPDYMVPSAIVAIDALPIGPSGKVDRQALPPVPAAESAQAHAAPEGAAEQALARVWTEVLGVAQVGRDDNFFELGGDSILSLQIVARLRLAGWKVTPKQIFERQTVARLAGAIEPVDEAAGAPAADTRGVVPLLPFQRDFFEMPMPVRHHWNQSVLLHSREPLDLPALRRALHALVRRHDALRLRFSQDAQGDWQQAYAELDDEAIDGMLWVAQAADATQVEAQCDRAQRSLDLAEGPLLRALVVEVADGGPRLLLAIHHLVVDGVSWRILLEDLQQGYRQALAGAAIELPAASSSVKDWALALQEDAARHAGELAHWRALADVPAALPCDRPQGTNTAGDLQMVELRLDRATTEAFLKDAPAAYRTQANDLLLTALGRALCAWSGQERILVDLEGHGREDLFAHVDLSRTVGWFTTLFPVALAPQGELGEAVKRVKEDLRRVPRRGIGHGVLKHAGDPAVREALRALPRAQVVFNYLGQFDGGFDTQAQWTLARESAGRLVDGGAPLTHEFSVNGEVFDGMLALRVSYSGARHERAGVQAWVQRFKDELEALVRHCAGGARGVTPSDFPLAGLDAAALDALPVSAERLEDLYPLSPMQAGLLFHSLFAPDAGAYRNQLRLDFEGLDAARFRAAWEAVFQRHDVLRSGFLQRDGRPLQWIDRAARLPWQAHDWRGRAALAEDLDALARAELSQGFDVAAPPLTRLALVRTGARSHHFVWTVHHLLLDGWSTSQLLGEVLRHYGGQPLPAMAGRYRDYIGWLQAQDAAASETYWRRAMQRLEGPTRLVDALPPAAAPLPGQGHLVHACDPAYTARLVAFAKREHVTLNTVVQAAWALLLQRYSGQQAVAFGSTVAGRPGELAGVEQMVGLFINTLPVICAPRPEQTVGAWLRELQAQNVEVREHEHTPLYEIQRWAGASDAGLFDTILVFENYPADQALREHLPGGMTVEMAGQREETHYPLTVTVLLAPTLTLQFHHDRSLIGEREAEAIAAQMRRLLEALAEGPGQRLGALDPLGETEHAQLGAWGVNGEHHGEAVPVHRLFARQAALRPDAPALVFGDRTLSYRELDARANRLAHRLIALGVQPETRVGVALERSVELVVALLGVMKAGGAYLPLDPDHPPERLAYMVEDSALALVLTQDALRGMLTLPPHVAVLALDAEDFAAEPAHEPAVALHGENLAYVIYTSGSTGKPKGAGNRHRSLYNRLAWMQEAYGLGAGDTVLQKTPFSFDVSVWEFFWPLMVGARLVVANPGDHREPERLVQLIRRHEVDTLHFVPSMLQAFLAHEGIEACTSLRRIVCSGEALPAQVQAEVFARLPGASLYNLYGPTEAAIDVTHWTCSDDGRSQVPIGRPISGLRTHVLDGAMNAVPPGAAGELYLGGVGLARGYANRAALTSERFVADPFDPQGGRLYRTGDLVRWNADGQLEYLGRLDHQVKVRGLRIELGEIEAQLLAQPEVREAVVVAREQVGGTVLAAYLSMRAGRAVEAAALRARLAQVLPEYMVPALVVVLEALPLNANGKVDRKALPAPEHAAARVHEAPEGELEKALARIWAEVLEVPRVGRHDHFFELGGHSLSLLGVQSRVQRQFALQLPLKAYFEHPTLAAMAALVRAQSQAAGREEADDLAQMAALLEQLEG